MIDSRFDPALVGIWVLPGSNSTFEVTPDGGFHVAEPAAPLRINDDGVTMVWAGQTLRRRDGAGETPVGTWHDRTKGERWTFSDDLSYSLQVDTPDGRRTFSGIWGLRDNGTALWTRELRAFVSTQGPWLRLLAVTGFHLGYHFTLEHGLLRLTDSDSGAVEATLIQNGNLAQMATAAQ